MGGFDGDVSTRRDLLKKAAVGGAIVATVPLISTFDTPASAEVVSATTNRFQFAIDVDALAGSTTALTAESPTADTECEPVGWGSAGHDATAPGDDAGVVSVVTLTNTPDGARSIEIALPVGCTVLDTTARTTSDLCVQGTFAANVATLTIPTSGVGTASALERARIIADC